jgi:tetratricopeptide (TPR) repeat protein
VRGAARILLALEAFPEVPRREELQLVEATALVALGRQREALTLLARAPRIPTATLLPVLDALALLAAERHDLACAEDALRLALELDPSAARAMRLADVHLARGDAPRAVPLLFAALRFEGQSVPLHLALSRAQLTAGDARGADATLGRVITRCPRQCGLLRARVALESSQPARAAELARGLLTLPPDAAEAAAAGNAEPDHRAEAGYLLGLALARDGRRDDAREALEDALQRDPEHRGARQALRAIAPAPP